MNWPLVKKRVIELALQELELWSADDLKEYDAAATAILEKYWRSVKSGSAATQIVEELQADPEHLLHPWSAAFISWVMESAGATKFKRSSAHRVYIADSKYNRENGVTDNPFWAYRINEVKPEPGDLVCQRRCTAGQYQDPAARPKKCSTYDSIDDTGTNGEQIEWRTHCDIVIKVRSRSIDVIGGNVGQSVFKKTIPLDAGGYVKKKNAEENQYIAIVKFRDAPTTMDVEVQLDTTTGSLNSGSARSEHFTASRSVIDFLERAGSGLDRQVRILNGNDEFALFTLKKRHQGAGIRLGSAGLQRLNIQDASGITLTIDTHVTNTSMSEADAKNNSELIERVNGSGNDIAILAPHGGDVEKYTDRQALRVYSSLGGNVARCWRCFGWKTGGGASKRWHITSTEISERSFPLLGEFFDHNYQVGIAFHGWTKSYIGVGGAAPELLRKQVADAIATALEAAGSEVDVKLEHDGGLSGGSPRNIVNRLSNAGIQIEQPFSARRDYWSAIADAVASVFQ